MPRLEGESREVAHPILRHQDMAMYFRHREDHYAVGNYRHDPIATPQSELAGGERVDAVADAVRTQSDFDVAGPGRPSAPHSAEGTDALADPERSINGMFSFTPDAGSIVGESATVAASGSARRCG